MNPINTKDQGHVGTLPAEETELLIKSQGQLITLSQIVIVIAILVSVISLASIAIFHTYTAGITIIVIMALFGIPFYILRNREKIRRQDMSKDIQIYKVQGILNLEQQDRIKGGTLYVAIVDNFKLPELVLQSPTFSNTSNPYTVLKPYIGQIMTAEYMPEIKKNRRIYDKGGNGYDFVRAKSSHFSS